MGIVHVRQDRNHMATTWELLISCEDSRASLADRILDEAHALLARLEDELTEFREPSPVFALNLAPPGRRVRLTPDGFELLGLALRIEDLSEGAFSAAVKSASRPGAPGAGRVSERFGFDPSTQEIWKLDEGARLGFGAVGKGFALDRARARIEALGFTDYLLSGGGSSVALAGLAGPSTPWTWGWSWRKGSDGSALGIALRHESGRALSIGVSGLHEKGRHLLDPRTGCAADELQSALVAHPSAAWADALSTAAFIAGVRGAESLRARLKELQPAPAMATIDAQGRASWNGVFNEFWPGAL